MGEASKVTHSQARGFAGESADAGLVEGAAGVAKVEAHEAARRIAIEEFFVGAVLDFGRDRAESIENRLT